MDGPTSPGQMCWTDPSAENRPVERTHHHQPGTDLLDGPTSPGQMCWKDPPARDRPAGQTCWTDPPARDRPAGRTRRFRRRCATGVGQCRHRRRGRPLGFGSRAWVLTRGEQCLVTLACQERASVGAYVQCTYLHTAFKHLPGHHPPGQRHRITQPAHVGTAIFHPFMCMG